MKFYGRPLIVFFSLLVGCLALFVIYLVANPSILNYLTANFMILENRLIIGLVAGVLLIFSGKSLLDMFSTTPNNYALVRSTELGAINITVPTVEHIVIKAAKQVQGVKEVKPKVKVISDGIAVFLKANVILDSNIPLVTEELQNNVKGRIEQIVGIKVLEVKVLVDYHSNDLKARVD